MRILFVVPARAGSQRIPHKNRQIVAGRSLAGHAIRSVSLAARSLDQNHDVTCLTVVATDDPHVAEIGAMHDCLIVERVAADADETIADLMIRLHDHPLLVDWLDGDPDRVLVVHQPTSMLGPTFIEEAVTEFIVTGPNSASTMTPNRSYLWSEDAGPTWEGPRLNSQQRTPLWQETGGLHMVRGFPLLTGFAPPMIGGDHMTLDVEGPGSIDVDTPDDLRSLRASIRHAHSSVIIHALADPRHGTGHTRRAAVIASRLASDVIVHVELEDSDGTLNHLVPDTYRQGLFDAPSVAIVDMLDHNPQMVAAYRDAGCETVALERHMDDCDFTVPHPFTPQGLFNWWIPTNPLILEADRGQKRQWPPQIAVVALGGSADPDRTIDACWAVAGLVNTIVVCDGPGVIPLDLPDQTVIVPAVELVRHLAVADLAVVGGGNTAVESAWLGVPTIAVPQNRREQDHHLPSSVQRCPLDATRHDIEHVAARWVQLPAEQVVAMCSAGAGEVRPLGLERLAHLVIGMSHPL